MKNKLILTLIFTVFFFQLETAFGQSIIGKWKAYSSITEDVNGTKTDMRLMMLKTKSCLLNIIYEYKTNGELISNPPPKCAQAALLLPSTWKLKGNMLTLVQKQGATSVTGTYEIQFMGDLMMLTHTYTPEENKMYHSHLKKLINTYKRA